MPGKVNPVIPEAVTMVAAQVMGNDTTDHGGRAGQPTSKLNLMMPLMAYALHQSIELLANVAGCSWSAASTE